MKVCDRVSCNKQTKIKATFDLKGYQIEKQCTIWELLKDRLLLYFETIILKIFCLI